MDRAGTLDELLLRYLAAFGPASARDAQAWCGLTGLGEVAERLRPQLRVLRDEAGRELFDLPDAPRPDPDTPAPVRFLPAWERAALPPRPLPDHGDEHRAALRRPNDVVPGTILLDGFLAATWQQQGTDTRAVLTVEPLRPLSRRESSAIAAEGRRLLRWSAPEHQSVRAHPHRGAP